MDHTGHIQKDRPVVIIANGTPPPHDVLRKYAEHASFIVCVDGGANRLCGSNIQPDIIIGDMDSVTGETLKQLDGSTLVRRPDQESTDLEKALHYIAERGVQKALILGATGERSDHFLGNISLLEKFKDSLALEIIDEWCSIRLIDKTTRVTGVPGQVISLWPLSGNASGVSTTGLKYAITNETLRQGTRGISNEFLGNSATITLNAGNLLVIISHPDS